VLDPDWNPVLEDPDGKPEVVDPDWNPVEV